MNFVRKEREGGKLEKEKKAIELFCTILHTNWKSWMILFLQRRGSIWPGKGYFWMSESKRKWLAVGKRDKHGTFLEGNSSGLHFGSVQVSKGR